MWRAARKNKRLPQPSASELGNTRRRISHNIPSPKAASSLCFHVLLWIRSLALALKLMRLWPFSQWFRWLVSTISFRIRCRTATPVTRLLPEVRRELHALVPSNSDANYTCAGAGCDHGAVRYGAPAAGCRMPGCCWFRQPRHRKARRKIAGPNDDCKA